MCRGADFKQLYIMLYQLKAAVSVFISSVVNDDSCGVHSRLYTYISQLMWHCMCNASEGGACYGA